MTRSHDLCCVCGEWKKVFLMVLFKPECFDCYNELPQRKCDCEDCLKAKAALKK